MTDSLEVRRLITQMPDFWHAEAKTQVARSIVSGNTAARMALDAKPDNLDTAINNFFHRQDGRDQMPVTLSSGAVIMPASLNDNYTGSSGGHRIVGGTNFHRRNCNASDNGEAEALINAIAAAPEETQLQLLQMLASKFGFEFPEAEAEDQNGSPMQFGGQGRGSSPADLLEPTTGEGTWSERDTDSRGPSARADRRQAHDARLAQDADIRRRYANQAGFDQRFGSLVAHVSVWR